MSALSDAVVSRAQQWVLFLVHWRPAALVVAGTRCGAVPLAVVGALSLCQCTSVHTTPPSETLSYRRFDRIYVYRPQARAEHLALLLSGDGGWSGMLRSIAERLAAGDTVVAGIDVRHVLASLSQDPAACV